MSMIRCRLFPMSLAVFLFLSIMMTRHVADSQNDTSSSANGTSEITTAGAGLSGGDSAPDATVGSSTTVGSGGQGLTLASTMLTYIVGVILAFLS